MNDIIKFLTNFLNIFLICQIEKIKKNQSPKNQLFTNNKI